MALPEPDQALELSVEELACLLVMHHKEDSKSSFNVHNVMCEIDSISSSTSINNQLGNNRQKKEQYKEALVEAYGFAFSEGFFIYDPNQMTNNWWKVSRRGRKIEKPLDVLNLAVREILPKNFLHPLIVEHAAPIFHMGKFDAAVFQAYKQVEIAVRDASGLNLDGAGLMKTAFNKEKGLLNNLTEPSEREGLMFVFAGAIQLFRNSTGHQNLDLDPKDAAHLLIHASYLLNLVETCARGIVSSSE